jgi:hypothetical protein
MKNEGSSSKERIHDILREEYQDGLEEIVSGVILTSMGIFSLAQYFDIDATFGGWLLLVIPCLLLIFWYCTKRYFTYPRMGLIPAQLLFRNHHLVQRILSFVNLGFFIVGLISLHWKLLNYLLVFSFIVFALYYLVRYLVLGFGLNITRFYFLASIIPFGFLFFGVQFFIDISAGVQFSVPLSIGGGVIILGIFSMRKFALEWPKRKLSK